MTPIAPPPAPPQLAPLLPHDLQEDFKKWLSKHKKIAVVHDWMFSMRGGERVLAEILRLVPQADLFLLFGEPQKVLGPLCPQRVTKSWLSRIPFIEKIYPLLLPLFPAAAESLPLQDYSLILSTSSCVAKGVIPHPLAEHACYIHSPMRYIWDQQDVYFDRSNASAFKNLLFLLLNLMACALRIWDVTSCKRVTQFIANSAFVARRCQRYYGLPKVPVVYPPVDVERFAESAQRLKHIERKPHILLFGAWTPYKKMHQALEVLVNAGIPVVAAGTGRILEQLQARYTQNPPPHAPLEFVVHPTAQQVEELYAKSWALLFPAIEDFGIIPLEASAAGCPVIAPAAGGTKETVKPWVNGWHFEPHNTQDMLATVKTCLQSQWSAEQRERMAEFVREQFSSELFRLRYAKALLDLGE